MFFIFVILVSRKEVKTMYKIILEPIGEIWEFKLKEDLRDILTLAFSELQKL